jgi:very-short-patch-repair endonuclease
MIYRKENIEKEMFYGASPEIFKRASELRKNMTDAEKALWPALRKKQIQGKRFRRQHPVSKYIVDFYCHQSKLAIEVDGGIHNKTEQKEHDTGRSYELQQLGIKVIRFTNDQIFQNLNEVIKEIEKHIT